MAEGTRRAISDVEVGEYVLAEDPETGERGLRRVTHLWEHEDTVVDLEIDDDLVTTTEDHPFWNATDGEWQGAQVLDVGDLVRTADGDLVEVGGLRPRTARPATAFNLSVEGIHTYFVGVGEDEILVHNTCPIQGPPVQPYEVGSYSDLQGLSRVGDDLQIHHVPQHHAASQVVPGHTYGGGPSIALRTLEHQAIPNLSGAVNLTPRQLLARDIWNLRTFTNAPNSALRQLLAHTRSTYPGGF